MNNDLISRETLKKALKSNCKPELCHDYNTAWCESCCKTNDFEDLIDNAPTVEPCYQTTSCLDCKNYDKENHNCPRYCEVIKEAIKSRPQGEWDYEQVAFYGVCSNCGVAVASNLADIFLYDEIGKCPYNMNFCPNCGAKMKGGAE